MISGMAETVRVTVGIAVGEAASKPISRMLVGVVAKRRVAQLMFALSDGEQVQSFGH